MIIALMVSLQGLLQPARRKHELDQTEEFEAAEETPVEPVVEESTMDEDAAYRARLLKWMNTLVYYGTRSMKNGLTIQITEVMSDVLPDLTSSGSGPYNRHCNPGLSMLHSRLGLELLCWGEGCSVSS